MPRSSSLAIRRQTSVTVSSDYSVDEPDETMWIGEAMVWAMHFTEGGTCVLGLFSPPRLGPQCCTLCGGDPIP